MDPRSSGHAHPASPSRVSTARLHLGLVTPKQVGNDEDKRHDGEHDQRDRHPDEGNSGGGQVAERRDSAASPFAASLGLQDCRRNEVAHEEDVVAHQGERRGGEAEVQGVEESRHRGVQMVAEDRRRERHDRQEKSSRLFAHSSFQSVWVIRLKK